MPAEVLLTDESAVVRFANRRAAEMLGLDAAQVDQRNVLEFVQADRGDGKRSPHVLARSAR